MIEFEQNLLLTSKEVSLEILWLPDLVHNINDVTFIVETAHCLFKNLIHLNHVVKAPAAQAFKHRSQESKVEHKSLLECVIKLFPFAEDVENYRHDVGFVNITIQQTSLYFVVIICNRVLVLF